MSTSFTKYYPDYNRTILTQGPHIFKISIEETNPSAEDISNTWIEKIEQQISEKIDILKEKEYILKNSQEKITI